MKSGLSSQTEALQLSQDMGNVSSTLPSLRSMVIRKRELVIEGLAKNYELQITNYEEVLNLLLSKKSTNPSGEACSR
jgi:hypothetical protein